MKKGVLLTFLCLISLLVKSQMYIGVVPCITTAPGYFNSKFSPAVEIGKQYDVFSVGFDIGRINNSFNKGKDTAFYFEFRPDLNVFQQGKFTNTFTPGIGYIPGSKSLMLEMTAGIEYSYDDNFHINMFFGQYYYSGIFTTNTVNFVGISIIKFLSPYKTISLVTH